MARKAPAIRRPMPPVGPAEFDYRLQRFTPAPEVKAWVQAEILSEDGKLFNEDHKHLRDADIEFLWAPNGFTSKQRFVVGTAEQVMFRCNAWQRERQEQQLIEWFGGVPAFLITLDATYCATCSDIAWCALLEHELYHVAHLRDEFGSPAFTREGRPRLGIQGHDVEEFVGVVRRYGVGNPDGAVAKLVAAAKLAPEVGQQRIQASCGTCQLRVA